MKQQNYQKIWDEALNAGQDALTKCTPTPMVVEEHKHQLDDNSPVVKQWFVEGGVCGFAWVNIRPATSSFARWLKSQGIVKRVSYYGGYDYWVIHGGQSMQRKEAFARAMAEVLRKHGINADAMSRID